MANEQKFEFAGTHAASDLAAEVVQLREELKRGMQFIEELSERHVDLAALLRRLAELKETRKSDNK